MKRVHVVAAVIRGYSLGRESEILISKRPDHLHQGGKWEFPGGKVERGEEPVIALVRELQEELGITAKHCEPLIQIHHDYPDKSVFLDVWEVLSFEGQPYGAEGQLVEWVKPVNLSRHEFPAANVPIVNAAVLPAVYWITPEPEGSVDAFIELVENKLKAGVQLIQLRAKVVAPKLAFQICQKVASLCKEFGVSLYLNGDTYTSIVNEIGVDVEVLISGVHLTSAQLNVSNSVHTKLSCSASCHSYKDLLAAEIRQCKFATLSPIKETLSHPDAVLLERENVIQWVQKAKVPIFALGGMNDKDIAEMKRLGFQGVSGIRYIEGEGEGAND